MQGLFTSLLRVYVLKNCASFGGDIEYLNAVQQMQQRIRTRRSDDPHTQAHCLCRQCRVGNRPAKLVASRRYIHSTVIPRGRKLFPNSRNIAQSLCINQANTTVAKFNQSLPFEVTQNGADRFTISAQVIS